MVIGIVGKVGAGKSACIKYIRENYTDVNIKVFSCDDIAKRIIENGEVEYEGRYVSPYTFFTEKKYQDEARAKIHPIVFNKIKDELDKDDLTTDANKSDSHKTLSIIESALPSKQMYDMCDKIIYIRATYEKSLERLKKNRDYTDNQAKLIYDSQEYYEKFYDMADYIVDNNADKESFLKRIKEVIDEICVICK